MSLPESLHNNAWTRRFILIVLVLILIIIVVLIVHILKRLVLCAVQVVDVWRQGWNLLGRLYLCETARGGDKELV